MRRSCRDILRFSTCAAGCMEACLYLTVHLLSSASPTVISTYMESVRDPIKYSGITHNDSGVARMTRDSILVRLLSISHSKHIREGRHFLVRVHQFVRWTYSCSSLTASIAAVSGSPNDLVAIGSGDRFWQFNITCRAIMSAGYRPGASSH